MDGEASSNDIDPPEPYTYEKLDSTRSIRLFQFDPHSCNDNIECRLIQVPFDEPDLNYIALSYVWGDPNDTTPITCNSKTLCIPRSLSWFLFHVLKLERNATTKEKVHPTGKRYLWADAICINQVDDDEKSRQVQLMREIYRRLRFVVAWLGNESDTDSRVFKFINQFKGIFDKHFGNDSSEAIKAKLNEMTLRDIEGIGLPDTANKIWDRALEVIQKPLFSRVWIIQELLGAQELIFLCGENIIEQAHLLIFSFSMTKTPFALHLGLYRLQVGSLANAAEVFVLKSRFMQNNSPKMLDLLRHTLHFKASDARDKIYALVGLAKDVDNSFIDYSQKEPTSVSLRLTEHMLNLCESKSSLPVNLSLLSYAQALTSDPGLPSWVPNWVGHTDGFLMSPIANHFPDDATHMRLADCCISTILANRKCLTVHGRFVDKVQTIIRQIETAESHEKLLENLKAVQETTLSSRTATLFAAKRTTEVLDQHEVERTHISRIQHLVNGLGSYPTGERLADVAWRSMMFDDKCTQDIKHGASIEKSDSVREDLRSMIHIRTQSREPNSSNGQVEQSRSSGRPLSAGVVSWMVYHWIKGAFNGRSIFWTVLGLIFGLFATFSMFVLSAVLGGHHVDSTPNRMKEISERMGRLEKEKKQFDRALSDASWGRSYCFTARGYVGWVPDGATEGDELWFFNGCRLPFVLRPNPQQSQGKEQTHRLIGDCYLHGLMSIEASSALEAESRWV